MILLRHHMVVPDPLPSFPAPALPALLPCPRASPPPPLPSPGEAIAAGVPVAVCSTSNERAVSTIVRVMLGTDVARVMRVFAGERHAVPRVSTPPVTRILHARGSRAAHLLRYTRTSHSPGPSTQYNTGQLSHCMSPWMPDVARCRSRCIPLPLGPCT